MAASNLAPVTVIVPMYNERAHIGECLSSLIEQDYPSDLMQVLVVDGMSQDGSREIVREVIEQRPPGWLRLLDNPRRAPAAGLNIGLQHAQGQVIIRLDAHSYAAPDFVRQNVAYLSKTGASCVGGPIQSIGRGLVGRAIALAMSSPCGVGNALFRYATTERYVDTVAFGAYKRSVFAQIGVFDEELPYSEDNEFNYRLRKHGGKILLTPAIRSSYYTRESLKDLWRQYYHYGFGKVKLVLSSPESLLLRHLLPPAFVSVLLLSGLLGIFNRFFLAVFAVVSLSYVVASLFCSILISCRNGCKYLIVLPIVFGCLHFGYGLGVYGGLANQVAEFRPKGAAGERHV
jgi:GT2 family glycosyltransferase